MGSSFFLSILEPGSVELKNKILNNSAYDKLVHILKTLPDPPIRTAATASSAAKSEFVLSWIVCCSKLIY